LLCGKQGIKEALVSLPHHLEALRAHHLVIVMAVPVKKTYVKNLSGLLKVIVNCILVFTSSLGSKDGSSDGKKDGFSLN